MVWDLSKARLEITLHDIAYLDPAIVAAANEARPNGRTAWVTATALGESVIRLLYTSHPWNAEWKSFGTLEAALAWCMVSASRDP